MLSKVAVEAACVFFIVAAIWLMRLTADKAKALGIGFPGGHEYPPGCKKAIGGTVIVLALVFGILALLASTKV
jgi:hypothetical protein